MDKKGQVQPIIGLLFAIVIIAMFAVLLSPLYSFIAIAVNATTGAVHGDTLALLLNYLPVLMGLILFIVVILLIIGNR